MKLVKCLVVVFTLSMVCASGSTFAQQTCTKNCLVKIDGLRATYQRGAHVDISIQNQSHDKIAVVVAVDGRDSQGWVEIMASVIEPDRPLAKLVHGSDVLPDETKQFSYDPWTTLDARTKMLPGAERPTLLRFEVHVHTNEGFVQRVRSEEFRLVETRESH